MSEDLRIEIPSVVREIIKILETAGYEAFIVGGCVRDSIMGRVPKDWDITTSAAPEAVKAVFASEPAFHTVDTGIKHGTVTVVKEHIGYEVTTYRIDGEYTDNRHPDSVLFTDDITGDLARRDFTMNAIAYNHQRGFVDPYGGIEDIKRKLIRGVGNAAARFDEDALRIMRAVRFSAQLDFEIEEETRKAVFEKAFLIKNISTERIREEFTKTLMSDYPEMIDVFKQTGILDIFIGGNDFGTDIHFRMLWLCPKQLPVRLAVIMAFTDCGDIYKQLKKMTYDNDTARMTADIVKYHKLPLDSEYDMRVLISKMGVQGALLELYFRGAVDIKDIIDIDHAKEIAGLHGIYNKIIKNGDCCTIKDLAVNGGDLMAAGVPKGKIMGVLLEKALDKVLKEPGFNNKEKILNYIKNELALIQKEEQQ